MSKNSKLIAALCGSVSAVSLFASTGHTQTLTAASAPCPATAPVTTTPPPDVFCLAVIQLPGNKLNSFDISWVDPFRSGVNGSGRYYLADRSNAGIDIISSSALQFVRRLTAPFPDNFQGIVLNSSGAINNNVSGPNGVVTHNTWLYAGDGNSTLKVYNIQTASLTQDIRTVSFAATNGISRVDEMDIDPTGKILLAANNAEDPPFATQFIANGDVAPPGNVVPIIQWSVDPLIMPPNNGLSLEQPRWDPNLCGTTTCGRFVVGVPVINSAFFGTGACLFNLNTGAPPATCDGALLVLDPNNTVSNTVPPSPLLDQPPAGVIQRALTAWDPVSATGIIPLTKFAFGPFPAPLPVPAVTAFYTGCTPNGVALNPNAGGPGKGVFGLACTPGDGNPSVITTGAVTDFNLNSIGSGAATKLTPNVEFFPSPGVTGGDEIYFNFATCTYPMNVGAGCPAGNYGDQRFYIGASKNDTFSYTLSGFPNTTPVGTIVPVLGIMGGVPTQANVPCCAVSGALGYNALPLIGTIPVSSGSHSVATDAIRNYIFVPFVAPLRKTTGCNTVLPGCLNALGGDTTGGGATASNSQLVCGTANGCIAVYRSNALGSPN